MSQFYDLAQVGVLPAGATVVVLALGVVHLRAVLPLRIPRLVALGTLLAGLLALVAARLEVGLAASSALLAETQNSVCHFATSSRPCGA